MSLRSWLQTFRSALTPRRGGRHSRRRGSSRGTTYRPGLEALEDRCVPVYAATDLGILYTAAADLNEAGQVVGSVAVYERTHAFLWDNGTMIDLGTLGGSNSHALGINDLGQVVGYAYVPGDAGYDAFLITPQGGEWFRDSNQDGRNDLMTDLGTLPGAASSWAEDINNAGQVVGGSGDNAFFWDAGNGMINLGAGYAVAINVVGQVTGNDGLDPFLWDAVNGRTNLGVGLARAADINDVGQVVGERWNDWGGSQHAFLWTPDSPNGRTGSFIDLPVPPDALGSSAAAINNAGQVVGYSSLWQDNGWDGEEVFNAALWDTEGGMVYLQDHLLPGSHAAWLPNAEAINDHGVILTHGMYNAYYHAYLLTPNAPTISIADAPAVTEGNTGTVAATFTVTLSAASTQTVTVAYATANSTATAGSDYQAASGTLTFAPGEIQKTISVLVNGDTIDEDDEAFEVNLTGAAYAGISDDQGIGRISDDEASPSLTISDGQITEGNTGAATAIFRVTLSFVSGRTVSVNYSTSDGTALAGSDYTARSGFVIFAPGETSKIITVQVIGDRLFEPNETFLVNLSNPINATIADGQGVETIVDDEPRVSISDVSKKEGNGKKTTLFVFTVTLSAAYDQPVTMSFRTVDGTATTSDNDYVAKTGMLTFAPGETSKTITIEVKGGSKNEASETFYLDPFGLSSNSLFTKNRGLGTILNDD